MDEDELLAKARSFQERDRKYAQAAKEFRRLLEESKSELGIGAADKLPGPKVFVTPRKDDDPPEHVATFTTYLSDSTPGFVLRHEVKGVLERDDSGRLIMSRIEIESVPGSYPFGITRTVLRDLPVTQIFDKARAKLHELPGWVVLDYMMFGERSPISGEDWTETKTAARVRTTRAAGMDKEPLVSDKENLYQQAALLYLALQAEGWGRGILNEIARRQGVTKRQAKYRVDQATKLRLLTPGTQGKAGRSPGPALPSKKGEEQ